MNNVIIRI